jgi:hypothetical protein
MCKDVPFIWSADCESSFHILKELLLTYPEPPPLRSYLSDVDPYEDVAPLNYLQFSRHLADQSLNLRNVRMSCFDPNITNIVKINFVWYRKDIKSDPYLEVSKRLIKRQLRHDHIMGHYQTQTVYAALFKTYYWPHMRQDIIHYIKHCGPCIRHHFLINPIIL